MIGSAPFGDGKLLMARPLAGPNRCGGAWRRSDLGLYGRGRRAMSRGETLKSASSGLTDLLSPPGCWPDASAAVTGQISEQTMTHAIALDGPWAGLRAYPRGFRTPDTRNRMEAALERLQHHRERFARHMARSQAAMARIDGLTSSMIEQLDAADAPTEDLEPSGDDEPSLCGVRVGILSFDTTDGEPSGDEGEPSNVDLMTTPGDQSGSRWIGGVCPFDTEGQCEDEGADSDREPGFGILHV